MLLVVVHILKQESAFLVMGEVAATIATPESALVQEVHLMTATLVETKQRSPQTME